VCCGLGRDPFFSRAVDLFKSVDDYVKGCYALDACGVLVGFPLKGVL
jgi:hypothetical protein